MSLNTPTPVEREKIAQAYISNGGNQTDAVIKVFPNSKSTRKSMMQKASKVFVTAAFKARIKELQTEHMREAQMDTQRSFDGRVEWLEAIIKDAHRADNHSAALAGIDKLVKLEGYYDKDKNKPVYYDVPDYGGDL